ncbi:MAG: hypothetical protein IKI45_00415 [Oscillospiraceae bacterium]|nr:hypothetical protein [Oscillospiraceae bacterium]
MEKSLLIVFCVVCFAGMIAAEIFVSGSPKKRKDQKHSGQDSDDSRK